MKISREKMVSEIELTRADDEMMSKLAGTPEFIRFREIIEDFQVLRAKNFLQRTNVPEDIEHPVDWFKGGYDLWRKALAIVDNADIMLSQNNDET